MSTETVTSNPVLNAFRDRIEWAKTQVGQLWPNGPTAEEYVLGFIRKPGMGSYVLNCDGGEFESLKDVEALITNCKWQDITIHVPAEIAKPYHFYFKAYLSLNYTGYTSVVALHRVYGDGELDDVRVRSRPHGYELYLPHSKNPLFQNGWITTEVHAISDHDGLVTWYPGPLTAAVDLIYATVKLGGSDVS